MFDNMFSYFGGLASKAKSKIIEKTLQPIIDYNFENIFEKKIAIKDLNQGITNVKLNTKYINGMLKTNTLKEFHIKFIKLEKLQLQMSDVDIVLDLNTQIQQDEVLESLEVENLVNQSVHMQMEQLKKEFLCEGSDSYFQNEVKSQIQQNGSNKTSSKTVMFLRIIDSIFGNIKIDIKNLRIKFVGKLNSNKITSFTVSINKLDCTMRKPQNSNQILFLCFVDQLKLYLDDTKQIGQMDNAFKLDVYLKQDTEPKITIQASQFQVVASLNQLDQLMQLFAQSAQVLEQRENTIKEAIRQSHITQQIIDSNKQSSEERAKIMNLNKYKLEEYFKKSYHEKKDFQNEEYLESTFIIQNVPDSKIADLYTSIKQMSEQKEFLVASFQGLSLYITSNETDQEFNYQQKKFKVDLENYFLVSLCDIKIVKHEKLNIFINSVLIYELLKIEPSFLSTREFVYKKEFEFIMIGPQKFLCKIILRTGRDQFFTQDLNKDGYQIEIQEPTIFASQALFVTPIKIQIKDNNIDMDLTQFNLILDKNQLQFIMKIVNIYTQNSAKPNNQVKSETQFKISKFKFSLFYHVNNTSSTNNQNNQSIDEDYIQFDIVDFFLATPGANEQNSSIYLYRSQFKFGCQSIWGLDKQIAIYNLKGNFGSQLKPSTQNIKKFNEENKSQITQYLKDCKSKQEQHLELQIDSVILNHNSFDQFYKMISQLNAVFNDNSRQTQNNQKKQQNFYFSAKIQIIEVTLYQTLYFCFNQFKYYTDCKEDYLDKNYDVFRLDNLLAPLAQI